MANKMDSLGDRMKGYENVFNNKLITRMPVIVRLDGCHFHTFTKGMDRPFDDILITCMQQTMMCLCQEIQGTVFAYTQSDEITLVLVDYQTLTTGHWFDYKIEKMCSVGASMASRLFNQNFFNLIHYGMSDEDERKEKYQQKFFKADFDCRVFNIPKEEVCNCILWRQKDAERNSIQMLAQSLFPHKQLQGLSCNQLQDKMMVEKSVNWNDLPIWKKRGTACKKDENSNWKIDLNMPILTQDRDYVDKLIYVGE